MLKMKRNEKREKKATSPLFDNAESLSDWFKIA